MQKVGKNTYRTESGMAITGDEMRKARENAGKDQARSESGLAITRGEMKAMKRAERRGKRK